MARTPKYLEGTWLAPNDYDSAWLQGAIMASVFWILVLAIYLNATP